MIKNGKAYCDYCGIEIIGRCQAHLHRVKKHFCTRKHRVLSTLNKIKYKDNYVVLEVFCGEKKGECLIDVDDYENRIKPLGIKIFMYKTGYCYFCLRNKKIKLHRFLIGINEKYIVIDHINRNPLDNRKGNLRIANTILNTYNKDFSSNSTSKVKGVSWNKAMQKWRGQVQINGVRKYTQPYKNFEECCLVTKKMREKMYNEYIETLDNRFKQNW